LTLGQVGVIASAVLAGRPCWGSSPWRDLRLQRQLRQFAGKVPRATSTAGRSGHCRGQTEQIGPVPAIRVDRHVLVIWSGWLWASSEADLCVDPSTWAGPWCKVRRAFRRLSEALKLAPALRVADNQDDLRPEGQRPGRLQIDDPLVRRRSGSASAAEGGFQSTTRAASARGFSTND